MNYISTYLSPLGSITLASDGSALTGLWFQGQKYDAAGLSEQAEERELPVFNEAAGWLDLYFQGKRPNYMPLLRPQGTPFQLSVWDALGTIPWGTTITYGALARQLDRPSAVRAVAAAIGRNPISILIPCHRVLGADGGLTGYAGGLDRKKALLRLEGAPL